MQEISVYSQNVINTKEVLNIISSELFQIYYLLLYSFHLRSASEFLRRLAHQSNGR